MPAGIAGVCLVLSVVVLLEYNFKLRKAFNNIYLFYNYNLNLSPPIYIYIYRL